MRMDAESVVNTPEWKSVLGETSKQESWKRCASRHIKLADFVGKLDFANGSSGNTGAPRRSASTSLGGEDYNEVVAANFHPFHCAASQGVIPAGQHILNRTRGDNDGFNDGFNDGCSRNVNESGIFPAPISTTCDVLDSSGRTPLHWSAMTGRINFMQLLLDNGASLDMQDRCGRTPLFCASAFGFADAVRFLLQRGADKDSQDARGLTPLHAAASGGHVQAAAELLSVRADHQRRAVVGATARHLAQRHGHVALVEMLNKASQQEQQEQQAKGVQCGVDERATKNGTRQARGSFFSQFRCDWHNNLRVRST